MSHYHHYHPHEHIGHAACVRLVPIFNHLEDDLMDGIAQKAQRRQFEKGEFLYQAHENDDTLYIVSTGQVRIYRLSESGKEQLVRILNPGEFTGEWTIFNTDGFHEEYAEASRKTTICMINRSDIQEFLQEHPGISFELLSEMSKRLKQSERQTTSVAVEGVTSRITMFLEENMEAGAGNSPIITLPMSRKDIASYLGTTPETLSRKFTELEEEGLIEQLPGKKIKVHDLDQLLFYSE